MKKGIRVRVKETYKRKDLHGKEGITLEESISPYIQFDEPITDGHNAGGNGKDRCCWAINKDYLEVIKEQEPTLSNLLERTGMEFDDLCDFFTKSGVRKPEEAAQKHLLIPKGTRVRVKDTYYLEDLHGKLGVTLDEHNIPSIQFDEPIRRGHSGLGSGKEGYCRAIDKEYLEVITEPAKPEWKDLTVTWTLNKEQAIELWHRLNVRLGHIEWEEGFTKEDPTDNNLYDLCDEIDNHLENMREFI